METSSMAQAHWMAGVGLLMGRAVVGTLMIAHGGQKLFGWLDGHGLQGTAGFFEMIGFRPGRRFAAAASLAEMASGLLVGVGFLGPTGPALMISVMVVAAMSVHRSNGLFADTNGVEVPLLYGTVALALALAGYGPYSLDALLGLAALWSPFVTFSAIGLGLLVAIGNLALRRAPNSRAARSVRAKAS